MDGGGQDFRNRTSRPDSVVLTYRPDAERNYGCCRLEAGAVDVGTERSGSIRKGDPERYGLSRLRWQRPCPFRMKVPPGTIGADDACTAAVADAAGAVAADAAVVAGVGGDLTAFLPSNRDCLQKFIHSLVYSLVYFFSHYDNWHF